MIAMCGRFCWLGLTRSKFQFHQRTLGVGSIPLSECAQTNGRSAPEQAGRTNLGAHVTSATTNNDLQIVHIAGYVVLEFCVGCVCVLFADWLRMIDAVLADNLGRPQ